MSEMDYIDMFENFAIKSALYRHELELEQKKSGEVVTRPAIAVDELPKREEMNHQVFISYSRKDVESVNAVREVLERNGITYWIDKEGIFSGENYKEVIVDAIETSKAVVFVSSVHSNESINVIRELGYAVKEGRTIIPVMLDDAPFAKSIRLDIADIHQVEFKGGPEMEKNLVMSIQYVLSLNCNE